MVTDRPPTEITEKGKYWLRSQAVSDSPRIAGDGYFSKHSVTRPEEITIGDLPPADNSAVREIDREALNEERTIGKWQITGSAETIERLWPEMINDAVEGVVWAAKVMTGTGREELPYDSYMIAVYTPTTSRNTTSTAFESISETNTE